MFKPFLKWAGGKQRIYQTIRKYIPLFYNYYEPFIGGGSVFLNLMPCDRATISDVNAELINCYQSVRDNPRELIQCLQIHENNNSKEYYYKIREKDRKEDYGLLPPVQRAARLIYLNKTCFNGLYRVNSKMQFNVPYGNYKNPNIFTKFTINSISEYLNRKEISIRCCDFEESLETAQEGDLVYLDPPYDPVSTTSSFVQYAGSFTRDDQVRVKNTMDRLTRKGVKVLLSNSNTEFIRSLYSGYDFVAITANRAIAANPKNRGQITELLIKNCDRLY